MNSAEQILEKITVDKEIMATMPKNNKKNIDKYIEFIEQLQTEYSDYKETILKEIIKRNKKIQNIKEDSDLEKLQEQIHNIEENLYLLNDNTSSYQKMKLDKSIYKLGKFYKENLENINQEILNCINKFKEADIEIQYTDFDYSQYSLEYMKIFIQELEKNDINSDAIKDKFEEIYWKCPDIIIHIELNFRSIYIKNENVIDKYYIKRKEEFLSENGQSEDEIIEKYRELKKQYQEKKETSPKEVLQKFLLKKWKVDDYKEEKIKNKYVLLMDEEVSEEIENNDLEEINQNIFKFLNNIYEFKYYIKFKFIVDDIKEKYKNKEQYKNVYNNMKKEIANQEKKLKKLNVQITKKGFFKKKNTEKQAVAINELILNIKKQYKELDDLEVKQKILTKLNDNSNISDVIYFANSFYNYLVKCIEETFLGISIEETEAIIKDLDEFSIYIYPTILNNITILEERDIALAIKDRYKLVNFNITKEDLDISNIETLEKKLQNIQNYITIQKSGILLEKMNDMCSFEKILDENK